MQAAVKLFQITAPQGLDPGLQPQKIALKLMVNDNTPGEGEPVDFKKILGSLVSVAPEAQNSVPLEALEVGLKAVPPAEISTAPVLLAPEQIEMSLENLELLALDPSQLDQSMPTIDLTDPQADNKPALQMLVEMAVRADAPGSTPGLETVEKLDKAVFVQPEQQAAQTVQSADPQTAHPAPATLQAAWSARQVPLPQEHDTAAKTQETANPIPGDPEEIHVILKEETAKTGQQNWRSIKSEVPSESDSSRQTAAPAAEPKTKETGRDQDQNLDHEKGARAARKTSSNRMVFESKNFETVIEKNQSLPGDKPAQNKGAQPFQIKSQTIAGESGQTTFTGPKAAEGQTQGEPGGAMDKAGDTESGQDRAEVRLAVHTAERNPAGMSAKAQPSPLPQEMQTNVIRQIVERITLRSDRGQSQMQIKLKPEFLGDLRLQVTTENQHVMIRITAESQAVKEMIEQNLYFLKTELQQHGLQIDKFDVFVGQDHEPWRHRQQQNASRQAKRGNPRHAAKVNVSALEEQEAPQAATKSWAKGKIGQKEVDFFA